VSPFGLWNNDNVGIVGAGSRRDVDFSSSEELTADPVRKANARVYDLLPRIHAAKAQQHAQVRLSVETSFPALSALLVALNNELSDLAALVGAGDPRLHVLALAVNRIADDVTSMLDALDLE